MADARLELREKSSGWRLYRVGETTHLLEGSSPLELLGRYVLSFGSNHGISIQYEDGNCPFKDNPPPLADHLRR